MKNLIVLAFSVIAFCFFTTAQAQTVYIVNNTACDFEFRVYDDCTSFVDNDTVASGNTFSNNWGVTIVKVGAREQGSSVASAFAVSDLACGDYCKVTIGPSCGSVTLCWVGGSTWELN